MARAIFWLACAISTGISAAIILGLMVLAMVAYAPDAEAHDWYDYECCSANRDCRPIPFEWVKVRPDGYHLPNGDVIPFGSRKIRPTPPEDAQQRYHWCTIGGKDTGHTLCLYVPQGGA